MTAHNALLPHNYRGDATVSLCPSGCPAHAEWLVKIGVKTMRELHPCERGHTCATCGSPSGALCTKSGGAIAARPHKARLGMALVAMTGVVTPPRPEEPAEATESPTTGRLDPNTVVVPGEAPIFEALVAEKQAEAAAEKAELANIEALARR